MTLKRQLELAWSDVKGHDCLRIGGWAAGELRELGRVPAAELRRRLRILPSDLLRTSADARALQPMAGRFEVQQQAVCFLPRFPFRSGTSYSLLVDLASADNGAGILEVRAIERPGLAMPPTARVVAIYPSADELPVNQLKLYVHFSHAMSEGWAARAVHVTRGDNGELLQDVFLGMAPELWDRERRRLTLLLDPGRIKRGLVPNQEAGYPLIEGVPIFVSIDAVFRDAAGRPLDGAAQRRYNVGPPVRALVDPAEWRCLWPAARSNHPLTVEFDRPLDHALLQHSLWVNDAASRPLPGEGAVGPGERSWRFAPESPWADGGHTLAIDSRLEDLAGNSLIRVFDRDLTRPEDAPGVARPIEVPFSCVPAKPGRVAGPAAR